MKPFPIQPIKDGRFVENRIVSELLATSKLDANMISVMYHQGNFSREEMVQMAQLIGYSLSGFGELSYVSEEDYEAAHYVDDGVEQVEARNEALRQNLGEIKGGLRNAAAAAFNLNEEDLV